MTASRSWEFHACTHECANCRASVSESIRFPFYIQLCLRRVSKTHPLMHRTPMALCGLRFADQQGAESNGELEIKKHMWSKPITCKSILCNLDGKLFLSCPLAARRSGWRTESKAP